MNATNRNCFLFNNTTRYAIEDIMKVVNTFEDIAVGKGVQLPAVEPVTIDIVDFRPSEPARTVRHYDQVTNKYTTTETSRWFVKESGYSRTTRHKIGLLVPELLYASPIEALAAETDVAPAGMGPALVPRVRSLYHSHTQCDWKLMRESEEEMLELLRNEPIRVRIMAKRAQFDANELKSRRAADRAKHTLGRLERGLRRSYQELEDIKRFYATGQSSLMAAGADNSAIGFQIQQAISSVTLAYNMTLTQKAAL